MRQFFTRFFNNKASISNTVMITQPLTLVHIAPPRVPSAEASSRTIHRRSNELQSIRTTISKDSSTSQLQAEVKALTQQEKQQLLAGAGFTIDIPPEQGLAMKADLAIPWNKLRIIRRYKLILLPTQTTYNAIGTHNYVIMYIRWLTEWKINIASEQHLRKRSKEVVTDNLKAEGVPFTFSLKSGSEEIRAAPLVFIPDLKAKIFHLLDKNQE